VPFVELLQEAAKAAFVRALGLLARRAAWLVAALVGGGLIGGGRSTGQG
jgi:hypothetical protein